MPENTNKLTIMPNDFRDDVEPAPSRSAGQSRQEVTPSPPLAAPSTPTRPRQIPEDSCHKSPASDISTSPLPPLHRPWAAAPVVRSGQVDVASEADNEDSGRDSPDSQESIPLTSPSNGSGSSGIEGWEAIDRREPWMDASDVQEVAPSGRPAHIPFSRGRRNMSRSQIEQRISLDHEERERNSLNYENRTTVHIDSDDSELDWESEPFDYEVPFDRPILHETYAFEHRYPELAPVLRRLFVLSPAQRTIVVARALSMQAATTAGQAAGFIGRIARSAWGALGGAVGEQAQRLALEIEEKWPEWDPALVGAVCDALIYFEGRTSVGHVGL